MAFHLEKKHWVWIGVAAAGVAGLYLLSHRGAASSSAAGGDALPQTGPPQLGNMTPSTSPQYYDQGEQAAAFLSLSDRHRQLAGANAAADQIPYTGVVSKAWKQIAGGYWEDVFHPGHIITEQQAEDLSGQNHGPYAKGQGGFFAQVGDFLGGLVKAVGPGLSATYAAGAPVTLGSAFLGPKKVQPKAPFTPGIAPGPVPSRTPSYGNPPIYEIGG